VQAKTDLLEVVGALKTTSRLASSLHSGQEQGDEHGNDRNHDQELDQGKALGMIGGSLVLARGMVCHLSLVAEGPVSSGA
jgi:hypothetical protein